MSGKEAPAAVVGSTTTVKTMADGTLRVSVDIEPRHAQAAFSMFGAPGTPVAIARLTQEAAVAEARREQAQDAPPADYGKHYELLYKQGWWHNPRVVDAFRVDTTLAPADRIEAIKSEIYIRTNTKTLTRLSPASFVSLCRELLIDNTLPRGFGVVA